MKPIKIKTPDFEDMQLPKYDIIHDVIGSYSCPLEQLGLKSKKVFYIPIKDKNGIVLNKSLRVIEGSQLHKKLLSRGTELSMCWIVEE